MRTKCIVFQVLPWTILLVVCTASVLAAPETTPLQPLSEPAGLDADVVRRYTFEGLSAEDETVPSETGEKESLRWGGKEPLCLVSGRRPGTTAVRLDRGYLAGKPFTVATAGLTIEVWFRYHGQGELLGGGGRHNGMILAQGDGYWSGLRLLLESDSRRFHFMIGRPKPLSAVSTTSGQLGAQGAWQHVAASWNGRQMRLYVNGMLCTVRDFDGAYTPTGGSLRIGYAGAGIGSLKFDVDEVIVSRRALSAEEILHRAADGVAISEAGSKALVRAAAASLDDSLDTACAEYQAVLNQDDASTWERHLAALGQGQILLRLGRSAEAGTRLAALIEEENAPEAFRTTAANLLIADDVEAVRAPGSSAVYRRLLDTSDLAAADLATVQLCLAEAYVREGRPAQAREALDAVLRSEDLDPLRCWDIRLRRAHTFMAGKDYAAARSAYEKLAAEAEVPPEVKANALLAVGHAFWREKVWAKAAEAFTRAGELAEAPAYLRQEANERSAEMRRRQQGLPGRDPTASRVEVRPVPEPAATIYVAPEGAADNPGTEQKPLGTLAQAREAVRRLRIDGKLPKGGIAVLVRGGKYAVHETLELGGEDSGSETAPIVYRAFPGEKPVFCGGVRLEKFAAVEDAAVAERLPEVARPHVKQYDVKQAGVCDWGEMTSRGYGRSHWGHARWVDLYVDGRPMQLARWPNQGFVEMGDVLQGKYERHNPSRVPGRFTYEGDRPARWRQAEDVWLFGYWAHLWAGTFERVGAIDTEARHITLAKTVYGGCRPGNPYFAVNLLEELDVPGEWYLDRASGTVYVWPPCDLEKAVVEMPVFAGPFLAIHDVEHVTIEGLTFDLTQGDGMTVDDSRHTLIAGCTVRRLGGSGIAIRGGSDCGVLGCDIESLGARGVTLRGGRAATLEPGRHFVENCHIHDFTRVDRVYAPAVELIGVGNRVTHNLIHDSPHHAIRLEGYEHLVEFNEIHSVVYESDDQAGLDAWGNPLLRGNVIRYNFWHHIGSGRNVAGQSGIRLDDMISCFLMYGNVFYRSAGGRFGAIQIHGGKDNVADNNLFIECKAAVSFSPWGETRWKDRLTDPSLQSRARAGGIDPTAPPHITRYPDLANLEENADRNFLRRNLVVDCASLKLRGRGVDCWLDNLQLGADPGFASPERRDFGLSEDSPVYDRFGFRPIPFEEIGLYKDERRASWPVHHEVSAEYVRE